MTDMTSADTALTDMAPFFERFDRKNRRMMSVAFCVSLILSTAIATHLLTGGGTGLRGIEAIWGVGVALGPLFIGGWSIFGQWMASGRRKQQSPDGRHPASVDDARNGMRIANAGFLYNLGLVASLLAIQVLLALLVFGYPAPGFLVARATMWVVGSVTIYLGNLWPRMPAPRTPAPKAATAMKVNRFAGWLMVIVGLSIVLLGVFLPLLHPGHGP